MTPVRDERVETNAIERPSGENAGWMSSGGMFRDVDLLSAIHPPHVDLEIAAVVRGERDELPIR